MLDISEEHRNTIVSEFRYVVAGMRGAKNPADKLYYLSASSGMLQRVFNIEYAHELVFAHQVLQFSHTLINGRVASPGQPGLMQITTPALLEQMENAVEEMANRWEQREEINDLLERISVIGFAATGNGNYLLIKGMLKLE